MALKFSTNPTDFKIVSSVGYMKWGDLYWSHKFVCFNHFILLNKSGVLAARFWKKNFVLDHLNCACSVKFGSFGRIYNSLWARLVAKGCSPPGRGCNFILSEKSSLWAKMKITYSSSSDAYEVSVVHKRCIFHSPS